jgi:hypothetical protein
LAGKRDEKGKKYSGQDSDGENMPIFVEKNYEEDE